MFASGFSVARSGYIDFMTEVLFLATFVLLVVLLLVIDNVFPKTPTLPDSTPGLVDGKTDKESQTHKLEEKK